MPAHVIAAHLAAFFAPLAAIMSLVYCWRPRSRAGMRLPLAVATALALAAATWAELAGTDLWLQLKSTLGGTLPAITVAHKTAAETLVVTVFCFAVIVLIVIWNALRPEHRSTAGTVWAVIVSLLAVAIILLTGQAVTDGLRSVWSHHIPLH